MKHLLITLVLFTLLTPSMAQSRAEKKAAKRAQKEKSYAELKTFFEKGDFKFVAEWADTQKGRRINLLSNPNSFEQKDNKINASLPYFGVVQVATMSGDSGIQVEDQSPEKQEVKFNDKKYRIIYRFNVNTSRGNEVLSCIFTIQENKDATLSVRSTQRNQISYTGAISPLD